MIAVELVDHLLGLGELDGVGGGLHAPSRQDAPSPVPTQADPVITIAARRPARAAIEILVSRRANMTSSRPGRSTPTMTGFDRNRMKSEASDGEARRSPDSPTAFPM